MKQEFIDGIKLKKMVLSSAQFLDNNKKTVDALNVFPVPDGDTGTNMAMTILAAAKDLESIHDNNIDKVAEVVSKGALKGARGNSGVILSQLFRGFAKGVQGEKEVDTVKYAEALKLGADTAYKAVMKPTEGTILTVARVTAQEAQNIAKQEKDFVIFYQKIIKIAKDTVDKTPELLPVLKQAGVVDSGGMGLLYIMMGTSQALEGKFDDTLIVKKEPNSASMIQSDKEIDIKYGYCTEFFIKNLYPHVTEDDVDKLKDKLLKLGDSIVVASDSDFVKVHVHTNMPGKVLQLGLRFGDLSTIKIDNMREQHRNLSDIVQENDSNSYSDDLNPRYQQPLEQQKRFGVVAVAIGEGIGTIFKDLSADYIVQGGQTMNPSIDQLLQAVEQVNAEEIFILPNNSNIILSAKQVQEVTDKKVHVIPSKSIPQGIAALLAYNPDVNSDTNIDRMTEALYSVKTGQVTYAVRDYNVNALSIAKDDIIGIENGDIVAVEKNIDDATHKLIDAMIDDESEMVTIYYGQDISKEHADSIAQYVESQYDDLDVECYSGGQPLYYYIISVE
ncbi:DAK2 domain-containing protein [Xylanivirga thermophila]|uniref:DAK2 domain-containing protein n=1 Tax=Xylanivirga thermophila TaxID=2496273 RepID=UPI00101CEAAF|nr:DAK2 domain-containing protein [Xylanivirga thermophila]